MINALRLSHFQIENRFNDARAGHLSKAFSRNSTVALKYRSQLGRATRIRPKFKLVTSWQRYVLIYVK
jgi:hypothetical protein